MLKCKYIFRVKYTTAISSNDTRKLLWFDFTKMTIAVSRNKFIVSFSIIFGTSVGMMSVARLAGHICRWRIHPLDAPDRAHVVYGKR